MVLPVHDAQGPEWPRWRGWLVCIAGASVAFAGIWGWVSRDIRETLMAGALPWAAVLFCMAISLLWAVCLLPLMVLVSRLCNRGPSGKQD